MKEGHAIQVVVPAGCKRGGNYEGTPLVRWFCVGQDGHHDREVYPHNDPLSYTLTAEDVGHYLKVCTAMTCTGQQVRGGGGGGGLARRCGLPVE